MNVLPPAGPPGTAGHPSSQLVDVHVVIDYQNIHLTAHNLFAARGSGKQMSQIHPLKFAERIVVSGSDPHQDHDRPTILRHVLVFRGQPRYDREPRLYDVTDAQRAEWSRDQRVKLFFRPLKYPPLWPAEPAREKGIDVEVALALLTIAEDVTSAIVILATHDTDLEPALRVAVQRKGADVQVETAGWRGARRLGRHLKLPHTQLGSAEFELARDHKDYSPKKKARQP